MTSYTTNILTELVFEQVILMQRLALAIKVAFMERYSTGLPSNDFVRQQHIPMAQIKATPDPRLWNFASQ